MNLGIFHLALALVGAIQVDSTTMAIVAGVAIAALVVVWFGLRYWLASTRPAAIDEVPTPTLDRLNQQALEHMAAESQEEDEVETKALANEEAPADLKAAIPEHEDSHPTTT